jgi:hypothetical protein
VYRVCILPTFHVGTHIFYSGTQCSFSTPILSACTVKVKSICLVSVFVSWRLFYHYRVWGGLSTTFERHGQEMYGPKWKLGAQKEVWTQMKTTQISIQNVRIGHPNKPSVYPKKQGTQMYVMRPSYLNTEMLLKIEQNNRGSVKKM